MMKLIGYISIDGKNEYGTPLRLILNTEAIVYIVDRGDIGCTIYLSNSTCIDTDSHLDTVLRSIKESRHHA